MWGLYFLSSQITSKEKNKILRLAYNYTKNLSLGQPYKIQFMALNNYFKKKKRLHLTRHYKSYMLTKFRSTQKKDCFSVKNFSFKNDFMTPRQSVLFPPKLYIYFTVQVFLLSYKIKSCTSKKSGPNILDFSTNHVKVFYTGFLDFTGKNIKKNSVYNYSYSEFQKYRAKFSGNRVLRIDIQNFFGNITVEKLSQTLKNLAISKQLFIPLEIDNIINFFKASNYSTLPQSQGSLASAILSQLYLIDFTNELETISNTYHLEIVRYVDDMYIKLPRRCKNKEVNEIINIISSELWKNNLNLNNKKTKLYSINKYKEEVNFSRDVSGSSGVSGTPFLQPPYIEKRVNALLDNNGDKLLEFLSKVEKLYKTRGNDMQEYHKLVDKYFSVGNDNANKIQNALIFGDKWKALSTNAKIKILACLKIITFDPEKYVVFLLQIEKNVNLQIKGYQKPIIPVSNYIKSIHNSFSNSSKIYTVREGLIDSNYYIQKRKPTTLLKYIPRLSKDFYQYIFQFVVH